MAGYDLHVKFDSGYTNEAIEFINFLKRVGRKYPVQIRYRTIEPGHFLLIIDGTPGGKIDALFQELILNRGLYYYVSSLSGQNKRMLVSRVIVPIYQELLESRFENPYSKYIRRHIAAKISQNEYVPVDSENPFTREFEIIFRKWDLKLINDRDFIIETDSLITRFLLTQINHRQGTRSPQFNTLLGKGLAKGLGMDEEIPKLFQQIHDSRTMSLHRLSETLEEEELSSIAFRALNYFLYFDEFEWSQKAAKEKLHGKLYDRIRYGNERWLGENNEPYKDEAGQAIDWNELSKSPCHDCSAIGGQLHCFGCDVEQCPRCGGQLLSCECKLESDISEQL